VSIFFQCFIDAYCVAVNLFHLHCKLSALIWIVNIEIDKGNPGSFKLWASSLNSINNTSRLDLINPKPSST